MKKVFVLFTVVMLMAVMAWEKQSGKPVESEFLLDNVEALAAGEFGRDICLGSGNVTCSTGEKVEWPWPLWRWTARGSAAFDFTGGTPPMWN